MYCLQINELKKFIIPINKHDTNEKVSNLGNLINAVKLIQKKLGNTGIKLFKKTCFGHFLKMKSIKFCSGFVHNFLLQQVVCDDPKVLEFIRWVKYIFHYNLKIVTIDVCGMVYIILQFFMWAACFYYPCSVSPIQILSIPFCFIHDEQSVILNHNHNVSHSKPYKVKRIKINII